MPEHSDDFEPCGSFNCALPKGHNMGRADIPANHHSEDSRRVRYEPCVLGSDGRCTRFSHDHEVIAEIGPLTPVLPCTHIWVRKGLGSGTSESTTIWGATTCVLCGAMQSGSSEEVDRG